LYLLSHGAGLDQAVGNHPAAGVIGHGNQAPGGSSVGSKSATAEYYVRADSLESTAL
jgi:hypothetical protein